LWGSLPEIGICRTPLGSCAAATDASGCALRPAARAMALSLLGSVTGSRRLSSAGSIVCLSLLADADLHTQPPWPSGCGRGGAADRHVRAGQFQPALHHRVAGHTRRGGRHPVRLRDGGGLPRGGCGYACDRGPSRRRVKWRGPTSSPMLHASLMLCRAWPVGYARATSTAPSETPASDTRSG
jgi:hypothetical protein